MKEFERWLHKPTGRHLVVVFEVEDVCELQGIDGRSFYAKRSEMNNPDVWERLP